MPMKIETTAEDLRNPWESANTVIHIEDAEGCYGEVCDQYIEHEGVALKPKAHSHLVITGHDPKTTPRAYPISK